MPINHKTGCLTLPEKFTEPQAARIPTTCRYFGNLVPEIPSQFFERACFYPSAIT
jgi:hypothetical protein